MVVLEEKMAILEEKNDDLCDRLTAAANDPVLKAKCLDGSAPLYFIKRGTANCNTCQLVFEIVY